MITPDFLQQSFVEPSERDLLRQAFAQPLDLKIKNAIGLLRLYENQALELSQEGYWLAYSGGKDSDVILELVKMAGVKYRPVYNVTTIDPPELVRYIKRQHPHVQFNRPKMSLWKRMEARGSGPPTRLFRWCCEEYKERGGVGLYKIIGVRAAESPRRAATWKQVTQHKKAGVIICPIIYWTDKNVWEFHAQQQIPHCELYDEGFKRLGCIGCPLAGPKKQAMEFKRWPNYEKGWRRAFDRMWARWHGVPTKDLKRRWFEYFGGPDELYTWWRSGKAKGKGGKQCQFDFLYS